MYAVGIDIGGTKVAIAIVNQDGQIIHQDKFNTDLTIEPKAMIDRINQNVKVLITEAELNLATISGIGIGAPGPLNSQKGLITRPPNLKRWINVPIVDQIQNFFNMPVRLENDASAAALAEKWIGAAQSNDDFVYITISTGIGAGIYANGQLMTGSRGNAGDFGHTVIDPSFGQCHCGQYGCLEHIASGTAIARKGSELVGEPLSTAEVFSRYQLNDPVLQPFINDIFRVLGAACVSLINTFDPEKIVIGGGVSKVGHVLFKEIRDYVKRHALNPDSRDTTIVPAKLDQDAGVLGAAALILKNEANIQGG
ncbi:ROK family protein [Amphibacillus cookii]|uniref:ROK family protein n=1 Tax=Amphibacillus cookii TaxID=767787 RepID=UPI00195AE932|nr:ROK family protein [Amphibacillus cookii]MBM7541012.1 glucokinase [Amphibacillus cookii]